MLSQCAGSRVPGREAGAGSIGGDRRWVKAGRRPCQGVPLASLLRSPASGLLGRVEGSWPEHLALSWDLGTFVSFSWARLCGLVFSWTWTEVLKGPTQLNRSQQGDVSRSPKVPVSPRGGGCSISNACGGPPLAEQPSGTPLPAIIGLGLWQWAGGDPLHSLSGVHGLGALQR